VKKTAYLLAESLTLPIEERVRRHQINFRFAGHRTIQNWAEMVIRDLNQACLSRKGYSLIPLGFGHSFRMICVRPHFEAFSTDKILASVRRTNKRLIVLDLGGTLINHSHQNELDIAQSPVRSTGSPNNNTTPSPSTIASQLSPNIKKALQNLSLSSSQFYVFVVSGRGVEDLEGRFADLPNVGLGSEHGGRYLWPKRLLPPEDPNREWQTAASGLNDFIIYFSASNFVIFSV